MAKYDWTALREAFIDGNESTRAFAQTHGIPYKTIEQRATADGWIQERERHREAIALEARRKAVARKSEVAVTVDNDTIELANQLFDKVRDMLKSALTPQEAAAVMALLERAQRVARIAQGLPTTIAQTSANVTTEAALSGECSEREAQIRAMWDAMTLEERREFLRRTRAKLAEAAGVASRYK